MLKIDGVKRIINVPDEDIIFGVTSDEMAESKHFQCPRYTNSNLDLSQFSIRINYINAGSETDQYTVKEVTVTEDTIEFDWILSRHVTMYRGNVQFIVCAVKTDAQGLIRNEWNTTCAIGTVLQGIEVDGSGYEEQTSDAIESILLSVTNKIGSLIDANIANSGIGRKYADFENPDVITEEVRKVAKSYYDNRGTKENPTFKYVRGGTVIDDVSEQYTEGDSTATDEDFKDDGMDCSTYLELIAAGICYEDSPYVGKPLQVSDKPWAWMPKSVGIRTAADLCKAYVDAGCEVNVKYGESYDFSKAMRGDMVFFAKGTSPDRYRGVSHCAIISTVKDGKHLMFECTSYAPYIVNRTLENRYPTDQSKPATQTPEMVVCIVRPRYVWPNSMYITGMRIAKDAIKDEVQRNKKNIAVLNNELTLLREGAQGTITERLQNNINDLMKRLGSRKIEDAELHLGFYVDEDGDLCQKEEE